MRLAIAFLLLAPSVAVAQPGDTVKWVLARESPGGGFALSEKDAKPGLRATNGATRALRYLGTTVPNKDKHAAFVLSCFDPATGAFAEPGGKPDVTITAVGVMAAAELGVPKEKYAKAMDYLKANTKTFEEMRIGAAAAEAWGVKDCPFDLDPWVKAADEVLDKEQTTARDHGSAVAFKLRLGREMPKAKRDLSAALLGFAQGDDGGWKKAGEKGSDIESTYRVMRAFHLLKEKPKDVAAVRRFVASHKNADGGYATKPGEASSMSGAYYAAILTKWLEGGNQ
jgi:hypothetical protein